VHVEEAAAPPTTQTSIIILKICTKMPTQLSLRDERLSLATNAAESRPSLTLRSDLLRLTALDIQKQVNTSKVTRAVRGQTPFHISSPLEGEVVQIGLATAPVGGQAGAPTSRVLEVVQIGLATAPVGGQAGARTSRSPLPILLHTTLLPTGAAQLFAPFLLTRTVLTGGQLGPVHCQAPLVS
jgi:hypothetical protein